MNRNNIWASIQGALASTTVLFVVLVALLFLIPVTPENEGGHVFSLGILMGLLPIVIVVLFFYYLVISLKNNRSFKFSLLMQSIFIIPLAAIAFYITSPVDGFLLALLNAFYTFICFSVAAAFGAWAWSR